MNHSSPYQAVEMVARQVEKDAVELPPLGESAGSDAIDAVVETIDDGHVSFQYHGFQITIDASKAVSVEPEA